MAKKKMSIESDHLGSDIADVVSPEGHATLRAVATALAKDVEVKS